MQAKNVLCTQLIVDVMGPRDADGKRIRIVESILRNTLCSLAADFKSNRIPQVKGFVLHVPADKPKRA
jgi:hypothetical protein